ncbi:hypothetical protein Aca07nite_73420 [Actinoplanes capillaceus]|uniref:Mce-associated membrane protein n=1 Tax=Actinoplanes campanulatus TaxID=113559 RepID=A0ABQ3WUW8_9ACTN|nr:hypothetical protein [Actinoplanes capillaceus]GID50067.1 hypothetical protein Aca07nite_73420 [Actinoplanes capillaceus]
MSRAYQRLSLALALTMALTACGQDDSAPSATPTSLTLSAPPASVAPAPTPSAVPTTAGDAKQQILDAYMGMQAAFAEAGKTSNPDYPGLRTYTTGSALDLFRTALAQRKKDGVLARNGTVNHPEVIEMSPTKEPTKAVVQDCMDTRKGSLYKPNGDPVPQDKGGFRLALADLERIDGTWKVTDLAIREVGTCMV